MMMTIKSQKCAFFRADPPRGQANPARRTPQMIIIINCVYIRFLPAKKRSKIHALFSRIFRIDYTSGNQIKIQTKKETSTNSCHFMPHTTCGFFYSR